MQHNDEMDSGRSRFGLAGLSLLKRALTSRPSAPSAQRQKGPSFWEEKVTIGIRLYRLKSVVSELVFNVLSARRELWHLGQHRSAVGTSSGGI